MEDHLMHTLEKARTITPDAEFVARSRRMLFAASAMNEGKSFRRGFWEDIKFGVALLLASAFMFFFALLYSQVSIVGHARTIAAQEEVNTEAQALQFNIELGEASYFVDSAEKVAAVLNDISTDKTKAIIGEHN